jgi:peptide/nickel transport system substrate-binding protein
MYWRWQEIVYDEQPYTFLYFARDSTAYHKRFQNVKFYPPDPAYDIREWFVPKGLQRYTPAPAG